VKPDGLIKELSTLHEGTVGAEHTM